MSRRQRQDVRRLAHEARVHAARRERALHLLGAAVAESDLTLADIARATGLSPRSLRRYRDRATENVGTRPATAARANADISAPRVGMAGSERERAVRALRALASHGYAPPVRVYRSQRVRYGAPSVERVEQLYGSWAAAAQAADLTPRPVGRPRRKRAAA